MPLFEKPVPKNALILLLEVAKLAVRQELERINSNTELVGLHLKYEVSQIGSLEPGQFWDSPLRKN